MTSDRINHDQAKALAAFINTLRPDWDPHGIVAAIGKARDLGDTQQTAIATIRAAGIPTNRTPAVVGMDGPHWRTSQPASHPSGSPQPLPFCRRCRTPHSTDSDCDPANIHSAASNVERRADLIAQAKAAAAEPCRRCEDDKARCRAHQPVKAEHPA